MSLSHNGSTSVLSETTMGLFSALFLPVLCFALDSPTGQILYVLCFLQDEHWGLRICYTYTAFTTDAQPLHRYQPPLEPGISLHQRKPRPCTPKTIHVFSRPQSKCRGISSGSASDAASIALLEGRPYLQAIHSLSQGHGPVKALAVYLGVVLVNSISVLPNPTSSG